MTTKKKATRKKSPKKTQKSVKKQKPQQLEFVSSEYAWEGAFPYVLETYQYEDEVVKVGKYIPNDDPNLEDFLYNAIRKSTLPKWIKSNLNKIRKKIKDELRHRDKLDEKLSKEQKNAISLFFEDPYFFERSQESEFFEYELEKAAVSFIRAMLDTRNYETFVRQGLRKRRTVLSKYGGL